MQVLPYTPEHADELRAVCLATASERARTEETHAAFTLAMYCDPYLEHGTAFMLLDDEGTARGYALASEEYSQWAHDFAPYRAKIEALGPEYAERVNNELTYYESVSASYPAHLHIDIQEEFTGGGNGRALMEALLAQLRADGVAGVCFGADGANERAVGFYKHMGFTLLDEYHEDGSTGYTFCMSFASEAL